MKVLGNLILGEGSFRGDSFPPFLFIVVLVPSSIILNKTDLGYVTNRNQKLNHLLLMDDLKLYTKSERELDSFIQTVKYGIWSGQVCGAGHEEKKDVSNRGN